jgi:putative membrane protein
LARPLVAWLIHLVVLWLWHLPSLFQSTLDSDWIHGLQHFSFLTASLLYWESLLRIRQSHGRAGAIALSLFTTMIQTGFLGALFVFSSSPWYPRYANSASQWGLTALEDQQLGGLLMLVPPLVLYWVALLICMIDLLKTTSGVHSAWQKSH